MEEDGTPPLVERYLQNEVESPSYYSRGSIEVEPAEPDFPRISPFYPAARKDEPHNVVRLLEENWYWHPNEGPDAWALTKAQKGLERQRSFKYSALRSSIARTHYSGGSGKLPSTFKPQRDRMSVRTNENALDQSNTVTDQESDTAESEAATPIDRSEDETSANAKPDDFDSLGTWAQRVLFFPSKHSQELERQEQEKAKDLGLKANKKTAQALQRQNSIEEEEAAHAAWRWRFNRRWRNEQAKQLDPEFGMDGGDEDGWEDALGYLDACGPGMHLQIGRMSSEKQSGSLVSTSSGGWGVLLDESQREKSLADVEEPATNNIASKARKVQQLYANQKKIEADVKARWGDTKVSMTWAGCHLKTVSIDTFGQFPFILAKIADNTKAHRLVVRGQQGRNFQDLFKGLTTEVEEVCTKNRLPMVKTTLLGTGMMEWSREKDYRVNVSQGAMTRGCDAIQSKDDVVRVAGALIRSSLPQPTRVTVNGEKLS